MPPLIAGLTALFVSWGASAAVAGVLASVTLSIAFLGVSMLISYLTRPGAQTVTMQAIARQPVSYQRIIYGAVRTSGVMTYIGVSGSNNQYLHMVITLAGHQVNSITNAYIEGFVATQGNAMNGTSYPYYQYEVDLGNPATSTQPFPNLASAISSWDSTCLQRGHAKVHIALQYNVNCYPNGVPSSIAFDVQGKLLYDPRTSTTGYSDNPALVVRDWLTDTNFGMAASASNIDDSYTIAAANICDQTVSISSGNQYTIGTCTGVTVVNGLCGITATNNLKVGAFVTFSGFTYATFLNGVTAYVTAVNPTGFYITTANANFSHGSDTGTATAPTTQKRYLCDGVTDAGQARGDVLTSLLTSMAGYCIPPGDAWRIIAGAYVTPSIILTEDDCRGPIKMDTLVSLRDLANGITGTFVSPANNWQDSSFPPYQDATALAADGNQPIWQDIQLQFTTDGVMTQRLAKIYLERIRRQKSLVLPCKLSAFPLQPGDTVMFTFPLFGFNQKVFEVQQTSIVLDTAATQIQFGVGQPGSGSDETSGNQAYGTQVPCVGVDLVLKEIDSNVFSWNPATDENTWLGPKVGAAPPNPTVCQPPTSVTATSGSGVAMVRADGLIQDRILVQWTSPADYFVTNGGQIEIYTSPHSAGTWSLAGIAAGSDTQFYVLNCVDGSAYDVLVYAINVAGVNSSGVQVNNITASGGTTDFGGSVSSIPANQIANLTLLGAYNSGTAYTPGMEVTYTGNIYKNILSSTGNVPTNTTYWTLIGPQTADNLSDGTTYIRLPVLGSSTTQASTDLPYNGNFDIFPSTVSVAQGWTKSFEAATSDITYSRSTSPYSGTYAQQLGPSNSTSGGSVACQPFGVTAGLQYSFSVWASSTVANPASMYFRILWYSNDTDFSRSPADLISVNDIVAAGGPTVSNTYQQFTGTVTAPSNAKFARIALYNYTSAGGVTLTFSGVRAYAPNPTLDYVGQGSTYVKAPVVLSGSSIVIPNSNFEASSSILPPPGWTSGNTTAYITSGQQSGTQSLSLTGTSTAEMDTLNYWSCQPGDKFVFGGYVKSDGTTTPTVGCNFLDKNFGYLSGIYASNSTNTSWTYVSSTGTAPANAVYLHPFCFNGNYSGSGTGYYDNVTAWYGAVLGTNTATGQVSDGSANFSATASTLTYRPTTNPLTGHDAGSNATINIASFTMRTSSKGDISISSGSVTALSYSTLYYVYYDDDTLAGGSVTFNATTTKATAIDDSGRFFVGSVVTPAAGASDTTGNNDGGVGAQMGDFLKIFFSTSAIAFSTNGSVTSPDNANDGNDATYAACVAQNVGGIGGGFNVILSLPPIAVYSFQSATLNIKSSASVTTNNSLGYCKCNYSLDNGNTFTNLYSVASFGSRSLTTDHISIASPNNMGRIQVQFEGQVAASQSPVVTIDVYECWLEVTT
jgi:hypothetical protein